MAGAPPAVASLAEATSSHVGPPVTVSSPFPPWFPALPLRIAPGGLTPAEAVETLVAERPDPSWLLLGGPVPASERHLWAAWLALQGHLARGTSVARSPDAEFLRLLAGTHQLTRAFARAGLTPDDTTAWLVHLPPHHLSTAAVDPARTATSTAPPTSDADVIPPAITAPEHLPSITWPTFLRAAQALIDHLGWPHGASRPVPTAAGLARLGLIPSIDHAPRTPGEMEAWAIGHIVHADLG